MKGYLQRKKIQSFGSSILVVTQSYRDGQRRAASAPDEEKVPAGDGSTAVEVSAVRSSKEIVQQKFEEAEQNVQVIGELHVS